MSVARAIDALARVAGSRFGPLWLGLLGVGLIAPVLGAGLGLDDHLHRVLLTAPEQLTYLLSPDAGLFALAGHRQAQVLYGVLSGALPWWTSPDLLLSFWKPLSALTHQVDYRLYPDLPLLMHAHSLVWYFLLLCATALLYRRLIASAALAGVCGLLYAVDHAHVMAAGWVANRNGVIAALFVVLTVYFHDRGRRSGDQLSAVAAWLLPLPGVLAGETYVAVCGYLFAHAMTLDRAPTLDRVRALAPYLAWVLGWHALFVQLGHGVQGSSFFLDPGRQPLLFFASLFGRLALVLGSDLALGAPELVATMQDGPGRLYVLAHAALLAFVLWLAWPLLRRSRTARFFLLGAALSAVPLCATLAAERRLLIPGIGIMGLVGLLLQEGLVGILATRGGVIGRFAVLSLAALHLLVSPLIAPLKAYHLRAELERADICGTSLADLQGVEQRHLIAFNAPDRCIFYAHAISALSGRPRPMTLRTLSPAAAEPTVQRVDDHTLRVSAVDGLFPVPATRMFLAQGRVFSPGQVLPTPAVSVSVVEVDGRGLPTVIDVAFPESLDSDSYRFLTFDETGLHATRPPGGDRTLSARAMAIP